MEKDKLFRCYELAINARNNHYDNFNKWMTYFYVAIGSVFLGYSAKDCDFKVELSLCGFVISILWHLSCKGYYLWVINWIELVKLYENELELPIGVYAPFNKQLLKKETSFLNPIKPANISTSKITLLFSYGSSLMWAWLFTKGIFSLIDSNNNFFKGCNFCATLTISLISTSLLIYLGGKFLASNMRYRQFKSVKF